MPTIAFDIDVAADPQRVFDALSDADGYENWLTAHDGWPDGRPDIAHSGSFRQDLAFMGRSARITWTVTELQSPSTIALAGLGPMGFTARVMYHLRDADGATKLRYESDLDGGPLPLNGRLGGVVTKKVRASAEESMTNFKAVIESKGEATPDTRRRPRAGRRSILARLREAVGRDRDGAVRRGFAGTRRTADARLLKALEVNTRAVNALTEQIARADEQASIGSLLTGPMDLLRRGLASEGDASASGDRSPDKG
jgi:uncharacterized protein YndB with AHSA1/START domain